MKIPVKQDDVNDIGLFKGALGLYECVGPLLSAGKNLETMRKVQVMHNSYQNIAGKERFLKFRFSIKATKIKLVFWAILSFKN